MGCSAGVEKRNRAHHQSFAHGGMCLYKLTQLLGGDVLLAMRQVPLERDINIAVNGCFRFATSTQREPFKAMCTLEALTSLCESSSKLTFTSGQVK